MSNVRSTKNFNPTVDFKLHCSCCRKGQLSIATFIVLETVRAHFGKPVTVMSGPRCKEYNKKVGGARASEHLIVDHKDVNAVDIQVKDVSPTQVAKFLEELPYANLLGIGKYPTFTHVDTRGYGARW